MDIREHLKNLLAEIQMPANRNLGEIVRIKKRLVENQNFEEAAILNKIEKSLLKFILVADKITKHTRTIKIKEIFSKQKSTKKMITQQQVRDLNIETIKEYGTNVQLDGIINLGIYNATQPKILWVLKEGNWGDDYFDTEEDHNDKTDEVINNIIKKYYEDDYYSDVTVYPKWRASFENIFYISHGIIEGVSKYDDMSNIDNKAHIDGKYYLNNIAFINIKKNPGGSRANSSRIAESYNRHKDFILKQINTINPDIIINCSGVESLTLDLAEGAIKNHERNFVATTNRLIINAYHPMHPMFKNENPEYVDNLLSIVKDHYHVKQ